MYGSCGSFQIHGLAPGLVCDLWGENAAGAQGPGFGASRELRDLGRIPVCSEQMVTWGRGGAEDREHGGPVARECAHGTSSLHCHVHRGLSWFNSESLMLSNPTSQAQAQRDVPGPPRG